MHLQENTLFDLDPKVKEFEVATSSGLGEDTFTRNVTADGCTDGQTDRQKDRRRTDFGTKLLYHFF